MKNTPELKKKFAELAEADELRYFGMGEYYENFNLIAEDFFAELKKISAKPKPLEFWVRLNDHGPYVAFREKTGGTLRTIEAEPVERELEELRRQIANLKEQQQ